MGKMRKMSEETLRELLKRPRKCQNCGSGEHIQFHHNFIYAGKQVDCANTILSLCKNCHDKEKTIKDDLDKIMLNQMTYQEIEFYSKVVNLQARKDYLNGIRQVQ